MLPLDRPPTYAEIDRVLRRPLDPVRLARGRTILARTLSYTEAVEALFNVTVLPQRLHWRWVGSESIHYAESAKLVHLYAAMPLVHAALAIEHETCARWDPPVVMTFEPWDDAHRLKMRRIERQASSWGPFERYAPVAEEMAARETWMAAIVERNDRALAMDLDRWIVESLYPLVRARPDVYGLLWHLLNLGFVPQGASGPMRLRYYVPA